MPSPPQGLRYKQHPKTVLNKLKATRKKDRYETDEKTLTIGALQYLYEEASKCPKCPSLMGSQATIECSCLHDNFDANVAMPLIIEDICYHAPPYMYAVAKFMVHFSRQNRTSQQQQVMEWIRLADLKRQSLKGSKDHKDNKVYPLPMLSEPGDGLTPANMGATRWVCESTMHIISGYRRTFWATCKKAVKLSILPVHALAGKQSNNVKYFENEVRPKLVEYFAGLEALAEPIPTLFVREFVQKEGSEGDEDEEEDVVENLEKNTNLISLPPYLSKRKLYQRWVEESGYELFHKGKMLYRPRPNETLSPVCSWFKFRAFWKKEFPNLIIRRPTRDICDKCYVYSNTFRYRLPSIEEDDDELRGDKDDDEDADGDDADAEAGGIEEDAVNTGDDSLLLVDGEDPEEADLPPNEVVMVTESQKKREEEIEKAALHIGDARVMRRAAKAAMDAAVGIGTPGPVAWADARDCIVCDYCMNLGLPFFNNIQPGKSYYLSQLVVNCFGIANVGYAEHTLDAYMFHEGQAKKGGDSVASFLFNYLWQNYRNVHLGPRKELTIILDNCGGQNKNRMVLRLIVLLVELGYWERITALFLIAGHTKNSADRLFNLLKLSYRKQNTFTMEELISYCNNPPTIKAHAVEEGDVKKVDAWLDQVYQHTLATGTVNKNNYFVAVKEKPGCLFKCNTAEVPLEEADCEDLRRLPPELSEEDRAILLSGFEHDLNSETFKTKEPGLKDLRKVEMDKFREIIPQKYHNYHLYQPASKALKDKVSKDTAERKRLRAQHSTTASTASATASTTPNRAPRKKGRRARMTDGLAATAPPT